MPFILKEIESSSQKGPEFKVSVFTHSLMVPGGRQMSLTALNATPTSSTPKHLTTLSHQSVAVWREHEIQATLTFMIKSFYESL